MPYSIQEVTLLYLITSYLHVLYHIVKRSYVFSLTFLACCFLYVSPRRLSLGDQTSHGPPQSHSAGEVKRASPRAAAKRGSNL